MNMLLNRKLDLPVEQICAEYLAGATITELAVEYNCSSKPIRSRLIGNGVDRRQAGVPRRCTIDITYFDSIDTDEKAYWLGFILADGNIDPSGPHSSMVRIGLSSRDAGHLKKFAQCTSLGSPICICSHNGNGYASISVRSNEWADALAKYGVVPNKGTVGFSVPGLDGGFYSSFYRGFFDGDGGISVQARNGTWVVYCVGPKVFIRDFACWLADNADVSPDRVYKMKPKLSTSPDTWGWRYDGNRQVPRIMDVLYGNAALYLDRKYARYQVMLQQLNLLGVGGAYE